MKVAIIGSRNSKIKIEKYLPNDIMPIISTVDDAEVVIAFWDGVSKKTKLVIDYARKAGKRVKLVYAGGNILPGNYGKDCPANGEHCNYYGKLIDCFCNDCDYLLCCYDSDYPRDCNDCSKNDCKRKLLL